jgi:hypothetical protein
LFVYQGFESCLNIFLLFLLVITSFPLVSNTSKILFIILFISCWLHSFKNLFTKTKHTTATQQTKSVKWNDNKRDDFVNMVHNQHNELTNCCMLYLLFVYTGCCTVSYKADLVHFCVNCMFFLLCDFFFSVFITFVCTRDG